MLPITICEGPVEPAPASNEFGSGNSTTFKVFAVWARTGTGMPPASQPKVAAPPERRVLRSMVMIRSGEVVEIQEARNRWASSTQYAAPMATLSSLKS